MSKTKFSLSSLEESIWITGHADEWRITFQIYGEYKGTRQKRKGQEDRKFGIFMGSKAVSMDYGLIELEIYATMTYNTNPITDSK